MSRHTRSLTDDQVRAIRRAHAAGASMASLARRYVVSQTVIGSLIQGLTYRDVPNAPRRDAPAQMRADRDALAKALAALVAAAEDHNRPAWYAAQDNAKRVLAEADAAAIVRQLDDAGLWKKP